MLAVSSPVGPRSQFPWARFLVSSTLLFALLLALQVATQFSAHVFQYDDVLGSSYGGVFYPPWRVLGWAWQWHALYPDVFSQAAKLGMLFAAAAVFGIGWLALRSRVTDVLHGSARWASLRDIRRMGLLRRDRGQSVVVGAYRDALGRRHYLHHSGPEHVLAYAPTRSGKGVGLVVPTLLTWRKSAFVTDLKGELHALTAGWRSTEGGNRIVRFAPADLGSACWNPLDEIRLGTKHEVGDTQSLALLLVDPRGHGIDSDHWLGTAWGLLTGLILHALYKAKRTGESVSLSDVGYMITDPSRPIDDLWQEMMTYEHTDAGTHPVVAAIGRASLNRPERERGSVVSSAERTLSLFLDPVVAENTSRSDFSVRDLMHADHPTTIYVVTEPVDKDRLRPLVRILTSMVVRKLASKLEFDKGQPVANYKHPLLMMMDELPALGRLDILAESLAFLAGYGIRCYLICQDTVQLTAAYGRDEAITANCHIQVAFAPNRHETAVHLSKRIGETTIHYKAQSDTEGRGDSKTKTDHWTSRPLLTPDECCRVPGARKNARGDITRPGHMIIHVAGHHAVYGEQPLYFKDRKLRTRASQTTGTRVD